MKQSGNILSSYRDPCRVPNSAIQEEIFDWETFWVANWATCWIVNSVWYENNNDRRTYRVGWRVFMEFRAWKPNKIGLDSGTCRDITQ